MSGNNKFEKSAELLERALKSIPLGTQTFTKSYMQFPKGISPHFIQRAEGAYVWDVDDNKFIDFVNSLLSISLGYNDPDVNQAVETQLKKGTIFSLASQLEVEVAEEICKMVPCAEKVRFGKNGSDATAGAIRLARAYTGKDYVLVCGYHGWQDWYIGSTTRSLGVPESTQELTKTFTYNDIESLQKQFSELEGKVAAVILEPANVFPPEDDFLAKVKEITHENGALLVFDETITGFRFSNGGAQAKFGVIPDLATFGKGLANGFPLSVITGKAEIMNLMDEIFFSFTFGGETLSLAAALAVMKKLQNEPVIDTLYSNGEYLMNGLKALISQFDFDKYFDVAGYPVWSFFVVKESGDYDANLVKTLYLQEMLANGILTFGTHNMSYSHTTSEIDALLGSYEKFFTKLKKGLEEDNLSQLLNGDLIQPVFKVR